MSADWECIDLFSGCGGFSHGLQEAGVRVVAGVDREADCEFPFRVNHPDAGFLCGDVCDLSVNVLDGFYSGGARRLLVGGPPCQPYSSVARGSWRDEGRRRGLMAPALRFVELAEELGVDVVMLENVPQFARSDMFGEVVGFLGWAGFCVEHRTFWLHRFGVPQARRRMFLVGYRGDAGFVWPEPWTDRGSREVWVRSAIGDLDPLADRCVDEGDGLHRVRPLGVLAQRRLAASRPGGSYLDWPVELLEPRMRADVAAGRARYGAVYGRMRWCGVAPTVTAQFNPGGGRFGHPDVARVLSMREAARLQTFPDEFRFVDVDAADWSRLESFRRVYRLIGNAVPPLFARQMGCGLL